MSPDWSGPGVSLFRCDCRELIRAGVPSDTVVTDPPYPNRAGHFEDDVEAARSVLRELAETHDQILAFWDELDGLEVGLPLVAVHIWIRSNTNRPDNYEPIYHFARDGRRRASRALSYPVIFPGLTGCVEATGHPTQKPERLMRRLVEIADPRVVLDPYAGSGSTVRAAADLGVTVIACERDPAFFETIVARMAQGVLPLR